MNLGQSFNLLVFISSISIVSLEKLCNITLSLIKPTFQSILAIEGFS